MPRKSGYTPEIGERTRRNAKRICDLLEDLGLPENIRRRMDGRGDWDVPVDEGAAGHKGQKAGGLPHGVKTRPHNAP